MLLEAAGFVVGALVGVVAGLLLQALRVVIWFELKSHPHEPAPDRAPSRSLLAPTLAALVFVVLGAAVAQPWPFNWAAAGLGVIVSGVAGEILIRAARSGRVWADGARVRWDAGPASANQPADTLAWLTRIPTSLVWLTFIGSLVVGGLALAASPPANGGLATPIVPPSPSKPVFVATATATPRPAASPTTQIAPTNTPASPRATSTPTVAVRPPTVEVKVSPQPRNGWNRSTTTVSFTASGGTNNVKSITYSAAGAAPITATTVSGSTASVMISVEGTTQLSYFATDTAGVTSPVQVLTVMVDETAPHTSSTLAPAPVNGWNNRPVTVRLSAVDNAGGSGVEAIFYAVDGLPCSTDPHAQCTMYTSPILISGEGTHVVTFFSTDVAGNNEPPARIQVSIDTVAPKSIASLSTTPTGPATIKLEANDPAPGSGVDAIFFQWVKCGAGPGSPTACSPNTNLWQKYDSSKPPTAQGCFMHLWIFSRDKAGNSEAAHDTGEWQCVP